MAAEAWGTSAGTREGEMRADRVQTYSSLLSASSFVILPTASFLRFSFLESSFTAPVRQLEDG